MQVMEPSTNLLWDKYCESASLLSQETGNIYTGSLYLNLISYISFNQNLRQKRVLMFSYGSGAMSSLFCLKIDEKNNCFNGLRERIAHLFSSRMKVEPKVYSELMREREVNFGKLDRSMRYLPKFIREGTIVHSNIDVLGRRLYHRTTKTGGKIAYLPSEEETFENARLLSISRQMTIPSSSQGLQKSTVSPF
jgi:3-hydroxy-3-methylglutaryl CoA synthase